MKQARLSEINKKKSKYLLITSDYLVPTLIILGVLALYLVVFRTPIFSIKEINCQRDFHSCQDPHLVAELEKNKGKNIIHLDLKEIEKTILNSQKTVSSVEIKRSLPNTLDINLTSTSPKVALKTASSEKWVILDDSLRVISILDKDPGLPTVLANQEVVIQYGEKLSEETINNSLRLAIDTTEKLHNIDKISLSEKTLTLTLKSEIKALLSTEKDTTKQIQALQAILSADTIEKDKYHIIDLRFSQPVLKSN